MYLFNYQLFKLQRKLKGPRI